MEIKECIICGKPLNKNEEEVCTTCLEWLKSKYPSTKLKQVIKWHKNQNKKLGQ